MSDSNIVDRAGLKEILGRPFANPMTPEVQKEFIIAMCRGVGVDPDNCTRLVLVMEAGKPIVGRAHVYKRNEMGRLYKDDKGNTAMEILRVSLDRV